MKILVIGGTGFIGRHLTSELIRHGHDVTVYHRGKCALVEPVHEILGDRGDIASKLPLIQRLAPDVVIDMILSSARQAVMLMRVLQGVTSRVVVLSSADVYRAFSVTQRLESGPTEVDPLTEDSPLQSNARVFQPELIAKLQAVFNWIDGEYNKVQVERSAIEEAGDLSTTILRLPMTYGPGDPLHRLYSVVKRMEDGRSNLLMQEDWAEWRGTRGYVENVAAGICLAATSSAAAGRIYNLGDPVAFSEEEWVTEIGMAMGWHGSIIKLPKDKLPAHLQLPYDSSQHWTLNTDRIRDELDFVEPVSFETALERTIAWERTSPPAQLDPKTFDYAAEDSALELTRAAVS